MKIKKPLIRSAVIVSVVALSLLSGFVYDSVWQRIDRKKYPQSYAEYVTDYSERYGVPEQMIYAVIKYESDFDAACEGEDGRVGLMGLDAECFDFVMRHLKESADYDSRYGPETSIKYGTYLLSYLHTVFGDWESVYAAKSVPLGEWQSWAEDASLFDENGKLMKIPDGGASSSAEKISKYEQKYREMYYD